MIIKESYFKRLLKSACDVEKLIIGNTGEKYIIAGYRWILTIEYDALTKKEKGAVVSMVGDLPEAGEIIEVGKESRQIMMWDAMTDYYESEKRCKESTVKAVKTIITLEGDAVILKDGSGNMHLMSVEFLRNIGAKHMNALAREANMEGPFVTDRGNSIAYRDNVMTLEVFEYRGGDLWQQVLEQIAGLYLGEPKDA